MTDKSSAEPGDEQPIRLPKVPDVVYRLESRADLQRLSQDILAGNLAAKRFAERNQKAIDRAVGTLFQRDPTVLTRQLEAASNKLLAAELESMRRGLGESSLVHEVPSLYLLGDGLLKEAVKRLTSCCC